MVKNLAIALTGTAMLTAGSVDAETLITDVQSGILGYEDAVFGNTDTDTGNYFSNAGSWANMTDGDNGTRVDGFTGFGNPGEEQWVGIRFNTAQNNVSSVQIDFQIFFDGGWFNGGEGLEPKVQFTTSTTVNALVDPGNAFDGSFFTDAIWQDVAYTTDYFTGVNENSANDIGGGVFQVTSGSNTITNGDTFTWDFGPIDNVTAIRIIGDAGGTFNTGIDGFVGVQEIRAYQVPEPSSLALLGLGGLLIARRRRG